MATKNLYDAPGVNFTPGVYQGEAYQYQGPDMAIAEKSMANIETRMNKAQEAKTNMDVALGKIQEQLHQDERTLAWFNQYKEDISNQIESQIQEGNFGSALRIAIDLGGKTAKDSQIQNRIKDNQQLNIRKEILEKDLNSGKLNKDDYDYLIYKNDEEYLNRFDSEGNYKEDFINQQAKYTVDVNSINWTAELLNTKKTIEAKQTGWSNTNTIPVRNTNDNSIMHQANSHSERHDIITKETIIESFKDRLDSDLRASIEQDFNAKQHKLKQLQNKLDNCTDPDEYYRYSKEIERLNNQLYDGTSLRDFDSYVDNQLNTELDKMITNASRNNWQTETNNGITLKNYDNGNGLGNKEEKAGGDGDSETGPVVETPQTTPYKGAQAAGSSGATMRAIQQKTAKTKKGNMIEVKPQEQTAVGYNDIIISM